MKEILLRLLGLGIAAALSASAYARPSPGTKAAEPAEYYNCAGMPGDIERFGENSFIVPDDVFGKGVEVYRRVHPEFDAVAFYNYERDIFSRFPLYQEARGLGYSESDARCIARIFTEKGNMVFSRSGYSDRIRRHECMHENWDRLMPEEKVVLIEEWLGALKNGKIKTYDGAAAGLFEHGECDSYCEQAKQEPDHFYIFLCEGRLPASEAAVEGVRDVAEKVCE